MHWGETKTWYGIPAEDAEKFEAAIKKEAPDLFEAQPDLLFQLVTLMHPERIREAGVRVHAVNQRPGEFVITFPQAYHAGFNHGVSFHHSLTLTRLERLGSSTSTKLSIFLSRTGFHSAMLVRSAIKSIRKFLFSLMTSYC